MLQRLRAAHFFFVFFHVERRKVTTLILTCKELTLETFSVNADNKINISLQRTTFTMFHSLTFTWSISFVTSCILALAVTIATISLSEHVRCYKTVRIIRKQREEIDDVC